MATTEPASSPPQPTSPGVGTVPLSSALGELLRLVLSSHLTAPDPALPLSPSYCSRLLEDDLCEKLAAELAGCIEDGRFPEPPVGSGALRIPAEEDGPRERDREWEAVLLETGAELKRMYDGVEFVLHVQEPYFTQLSAGTKNVEGRLAAGNYNCITQGSLLLFNKCLLLEVEAVRKYSSFSEMLQAEMISNVLPGISSIEEGVKVYRKFYTEEKENSSGVLAISVSKPPRQPYETMTELLARLGYDGLGRLLGLANTAGTVPYGVPPPRSILISSCMKLHQPTVKGCSLTDAARALAKHVHRSSDGWWGGLHGSDLNKNQLAYKVIHRLLSECCWMNIHVTQPYGPVFEIRVREGYGARWSHNGLKITDCHVICATSSSKMPQRSQETRAYTNSEHKSHSKSRCSQMELANQNLFSPSCLLCSLDFWSRTLQKVFSTGGSTRIQSVFYCCTQYTRSLASLIHCRIF